MVFTEARNGNAYLRANFNGKSQILYENLYGSSDSSVTDTSDTNTGSSVNSEGTSFKAGSRWLANKIWHSQTFM